ncbi:histidine kinase [Caulobacter flavus]|uniref:histidine kinase n=1 Tax=Caulobacter flavus TaxID=1679497 RepID=A0A2N5CP26_9CAUL|nr:histidine kinase [Caulobacter flavus]PLR08701.1 histidine kinase [Caulobacter flavus]
MLDSNDYELARLIVENARDYAIFTMDGEGQITRWSKGAENVLGYTHAEAVGMNFATLFTASDREAGSDKTELERALVLGRAEDTRWHLRRSGERFWANGVTMAIETPGSKGLLKILRDETPAKLAEDQRILLLNELNHRIKNTLAVIQSIAEQTLRTRSGDDQARRSLVDRIIAVSQAHDVLVEQNWAGADLAVIVRQALAPHRSGGALVTMDGPEVRLGSQQAVSMSLIVHELATNAIKYGALSTSAGQVAVSWNLAHDQCGARHLTFLWQERHGPSVSAPAQQGFGSRMIARAFHDGGGQARLEFPPEGVRCVIVTPLAGGRGRQAAPRWAKPRRPGLNSGLTAPEAETATRAGPRTYDRRALLRFAHRVGHDRATRSNRLRRARRRIAGGLVFDLGIELRA